MSCRATACCTCWDCSPARTCRSRRRSSPPTRAVSDLIAVNTTLYADDESELRRRAERRLWRSISRRGQTGHVVEDQRRQHRRSRGVRDRRHAARRDRSGQAAAGGYANAIVALDPKTLQLKDWFTEPAVRSVTSPPVFRTATRTSSRPGRGRAHAAARRRVTRRRESLDAALSVRPVPRAVRRSAPDALTVWQETPPAPAAGSSPATAGAMAPPAHRTRPAGTLPGAAGGPATNGACWPSRWCNERQVLHSTGLGVAEHSVAGAPLVVNGVAFASRPAPNAVFRHPLCAGRGEREELWNSGKTITSSPPDGASGRRTVRCTSRPLTGPCTLRASQWSGAKSGPAHSERRREAPVTPPPAILPKNL